ncbi:MAG: hypothetical protein AAFP90_14830, partial [Planctomycetota bacterium]
ETCIRECRAHRVVEDPPDDWKIAVLRGMLCGALSGQKQFDAAEPLLLQSIDEIKKQNPTSDRHLRRYGETLTYLIDLYRQRNQDGDAEKAAKWERDRLPMAGVLSE